MTGDNRFDTRADMLSSKMRATSDALASQLGANGQRPFTTAKTKREALAWWAQHYHDQYGSEILQTMQPADVAALNMELLRYLNPEVPDATPTR